VLISSRYDVLVNKTSTAMAGAPWLQEAPPAVHGQALVQSNKIASSYLTLPLLMLNSSSAKRAA